MQNRLVVAHTNHIVLKDVKMKVNQKGRAKVLKEKRKNVHAFLQGIITDDESALTLTQKELFYNPYEVASFSDKTTLEAVSEALYVCISANGKMFYR